MIDDDDGDIHADHFKAYQHEEGDTYFNLKLSHANEPLQCSQQCQSLNGTQWYTGQITTAENVKFVEHENTTVFLSSASVPLCGRLSPLPLFYDQMQ